jgi:glyoxylase-like metal-dependent hydrolase (beta-lactamase superfamily II)
MRAETPVVRCHMLDSGYCLARESHLIRGGRNTVIHCHSLAALLRHPGHGWLLWDTGYAPRMLTATEHLPYALYRRITPLRLQPELAIASQLSRFGLTAADIGTIIVSHFHADHIAGLRDFPSASFIATRQAYAQIAGASGLAALRHGFIPALLPHDFAARTMLLDAFAGPELPGLGATHDLFGDGALVLMELPGHARGQIGLLANTDRGRILFAADSCWHRRAIREQRLPHPIANLIVDDPRALRSTIARLYAFTQAEPEVVIIPSHCPEAYRKEVAAWG